LRLYRDERQALADIPTLRMLTMSADQLTRRATMIVRRLRRVLPPAVLLIKHPGESSAGGGSFPLLQLPTTLVEVRIAGYSPQQLEAAMRRATTPVIGRIHRDRFLFDVRTVLERDLPALAQSILEVYASVGKDKP
jgi:L-seryl-tRNA(Ser) seleniumtransferase